MNRYCSGSQSQGHVMRACTCGVFHSQASSFSVPYHMYDYDHDHDHDYSSSVDCTLSLRTPSTRFTQDEDKRSRHHSVSNLCWDILQSKHNPPSNIKPSPTTDPLLARRCANCDTTSTPLWRNGPRGPKSLCNACGIRFKKEERRASVAVATQPPAAAAASGGVMESAQVYNNSWYAQAPQSQKIRTFSSGMGNEFRWVDDADNGIPFPSWRLSVTDRTSLVHHFKR